MSAIAGIVNINDASVDETAIEAMAAALSDYKVDQVEIMKVQGAAFACGLQWITPESRGEHNPVGLPSQTIMLVCDTILDNRVALYNELEPRQQLADMSDSQLVLAAYMKWETACVTRLVGDYAFVVYDARRRCLFSAIDPAGIRPLNYSWDGSRFLFATTLKPLLAALAHKPALNEGWLAEFLTIGSNLNVASTRETVYEGVFQLCPGEYLTIEQGMMEIRRYWIPESWEPLILESDEAYLEAFRKLMDEAVACRLRTWGRVGIFLSGGLDSTTVAAFAAPALQQREQQLMAYTSVPVFTEVIREGNDAKGTADESEIVDEMVACYPNIIWKTVAAEGRDSYSNIDRMLEWLETPFKMVGNLYWTQGILEEAARDGCKVMLSGQYGNFTISQGEMPLYIRHLIKHFQIGEVYRQLKAHGRRYRVGGRKMLVAVAVHLLTEKNMTFLDFATGLANPDLVDRLDLPGRFRAQGLIRSKRPTLLDERLSAMNAFALSHIGNTEARLGLQFGLMQRDPTRDARVLEFCYKIPYDNYIKLGMERSLVRRAMVGRLPKRILDNHSVRGLQGADWVLRLKPHLKGILEEAGTWVGQPDPVDRFVDKAWVTACYNKLRHVGDISVCDHEEIRRLLIVLIIRRYVNAVIDR